ncbi:MAG: hypothetical protein LUQ36_06795 [Methanoregula sp.]|nr:hypothetical protein [Methanoregula sp.]
MNIEPLVRSEATFGEKNCICSDCKGEFCVKFSPSTMMSEREKIVQQALPFNPLDKHKEILEDLAWIEGLLVMEDSESVGRSYWDDLKKEINYLVQQDQYKSKKEGKNSKSNKK